MSEWQDIETAKRNHGGVGDEWIIGWNGGWDKPLPITWLWDGWATPDQAECNYGEVGEGMYRVLPTHWQPLPKPPVKKRLPSGE